MQRQSESKIKGNCSRQTLQVGYWLCVLSVCCSYGPTLCFGQQRWLEWNQLPELPNDLGVAGPLVGVHNDALIVAGGANFARPVWDNEKQWSDDIWVLTAEADEAETAQGAENGSGQQLRWIDAGKLPQRRAYAACVSTEHGVVCLGGNDAEEVSDQAYLMRWDGTRVVFLDLPPLPTPNVYGQACFVSGKLYLICGQSGNELQSCMAGMWSFDLEGWIKASESVEASDSKNGGASIPVSWIEELALPGPSRAFHMSAVQHDGYYPSMYVMGGRREEEGKTEFLNDVWQFTPETKTWKQRQSMPLEMMAGTAIGYGQSHIFLLGAATPENFFDVDRLRDDHPGFPRRAFAYHSITDSWTDAGETPICQVTTTAVPWNGKIVIASGEVRPRVRTNKVYAVQPVVRSGAFGWINYGVLIIYLLSMVAVGFYFARKNKNTDQYFRGGQSIPWWAAGCSIFATMLSSLTFTGIPSKAFAQDWVYSIGNFMIPLVAVIAVYVALPFYRRIDATSAYEYLEKRFNRVVRLFGSISFALFHVFRMAVVMSLTGLALAVATPLTPSQSVLLMGILSIVYCTMGGIEAVIWTDTVQTFVLLGGAAVALVLLISGVEGGVTGFVDATTKAEKWNIANLHWDVTSSQIALWVIVLGGIGQNLSSYTADQAVVQRYMTTSDQRLAARSIWTNAVLTIPATLMFFGMGTALFAYYQSNPEKLDPTITTDQIFPLFISKEMPVGIAGLLVAGIFAAAQSTVSTSMNSTATTIVTDLLRPLRVIRSESGYLVAAMVCTLTLGVVGTALALVFVDPGIRSLFDQFIKVIGLFMGVLGGLFVLGTLTRRANGGGAVVGAAIGTAVMYVLWKYSAVNGYLYTAAGILSCFLAGYVASFFFQQHRNLRGLTIWDVGSGE